MPVLSTPPYRPPFLFRNGQFATLYPPLFRQTPFLVTPGRQRIETPDGDFLVIDRHQGSARQSRKLVVISHGLEGHSRKKYVLGMAKLFLSIGYDAACWNQRGCSGESNLTPRTYHSGETNDIHSVITACLENNDYEEVVLVGFSMGGNQILKYLGEDPDRVPDVVKAAVAFSVPVDLDASEKVLSRPSRRLYFEYFMRGLRQKIEKKAQYFPSHVNVSDLKGIHSLRQFDTRFTAPANGFLNAEDYYEKASSISVLHGIRVRTLLINALDDPFLSPSCYPVAIARQSSALSLEMPRYGGHVGFALKNAHNVYWSEQRVRMFLEESCT